jgi:predicted kinase
MTSVSIRLASPADAEAISAVVRSCLHEVNVKDYGPTLAAEQAKTWTTDGAIGRLREHVMFAAVSGKEVVGVAGFDGQQARTVFVRPDWHGKGIGSSLMCAIEELAMEMGRREISLRSSIAAQSFYAHLGYTPAQDVFHGEERTILMQKPLATGTTSSTGRDDLAVYAMCGLAFSGKSTAALQIVNALGLDLISLDAINKERSLLGGEGIPDRRWEETSFIAMTRLRRCLRRGRSAVVDDTFSHRFLRERCQRVAQSCGARFTIIFIDTPQSVIASRRRTNALERTRDPIHDEVFQHHVARFQRPEDDELAVRFACDRDMEQWIAAASGGVPWSGRQEGYTGRHD